MQWDPETDKISNNSDAFDDDVEVYNENNLNGDSEGRSPNHLIISDLRDPKRIGT